ncbi:MAG: hypothetical protein NTV80_24080 [Verrucomicrobia bacterium]|nr:hypothetical protein [Verrucomicrobiota bacterium]
MAVSLEEALSPIVIPGTTGAAGDVAGITDEEILQGRGFGTAAVSADGKGGGLVALEASSSWNFCFYHRNHSGFDEGEFEGPSLTS